MKIYKTVVYCRLSRDDGNSNESNSIVGQRAYCTDFISKQNDMEIACEPIVDDGYSGVNFERPGFEKLMECVKKGEIDCIVVRDLSRFARNYIDAGRYLEKIFPMLGVRFIAINDNYDSISVDRASEAFVLPFKNLINDAYSKDISMKIRSSKEIGRKNGEYLGSFAPYGYKKDPKNHKQLIVDETASEVVKYIYKLFKDGLSIGKIAKRLNDLKILSPYEYKHSQGLMLSSSLKKKEVALWEYTTVRRILTDEVYVGVLTQGKTRTPNHKVRVQQKVDKSEWIRIEDTHEAIVSQEDFYNIRQLLTRDMRSTTIEGDANELSGFCFCADCGATMVRRKTVHKGKVNVYYFCSNYKTYGTCNSHNIRKGIIETSVLKAIRERTKSVIKLDHMLSGVSENVEVRTLEMRIENVKLDISSYDDRKLRLSEDLSAKIINRDEHDAFLQAYDKVIDQKKSEIRKLERKLEKAYEIGTTTRSWTMAFYENQNFEKLSRRLLMSLVNRIVIYEDKTVKVEFKFEDEYNVLVKLSEKQNEE